MCSIIGYIGNQFTQEDIRPYFDRSRSRGPDCTRYVTLGQGAGFLGFHRLAIMGLDDSGMQPFLLGGKALVCNGEIYGFRKLKEELLQKGYRFQSGSDCEILLPLLKKKG